MSAGHNECVCVCLSAHGGKRVAQWKEEHRQMGSGVLSEGKSHLCLCWGWRFENLCGYAKALISANVLLCSFTFMNMYTTDLKQSSVHKDVPASVNACSGFHLSVSVFFSCLQKKGKEKQNKT